jgi:hypothetical protein
LPNLPPRASQLHVRSMLTSCIVFFRVQLFDRRTI